jgi:hypothetical protein
MACRFCGGGDEWIKNCIWREDRASGWEWWHRSFRCCDLCYASRRDKLMIVPGPFVVTARCVRCGTYGNPRDFENVHPAGRKDCYGGLCGECAELARHSF